MNKIILKELLQKFRACLINKLWKRLQNVFIEAWDSIKEKLWDSIKEEIKQCTLELIIDAEAYLTSVETQQKEKLIIDMVVSSMELPLLLRPFKIIIKKILKSKIEETVKNLLSKSKETLTHL